MKEDKTSRRILELLKWKGPLSQESLAREVGVSTMAVSKQLSNFVAKELVVYTEEKQERGRPIKMWQITKSAEEQFKNNHASLAVSFINHARKTLGDSAVNTIVSAHAESKIQDYQRKLDPNASFKTRLEQYTKLRHLEGYMAECRELGEGGYELIENHCPICTAASFCAELCAAELQVMESLLGTVDIERTEYIQADQRRCVYIIRSRG